MKDISIGGSETYDVEIKIKNKRTGQAIELSEMFPFVFLERTFETEPKEHQSISGFVEMQRSSHNKIEIILSTREIIKSSGIKI